MRGWIRSQLSFKRVRWFRCVGWACLLWSVFTLGGCCLGQLVVSAQEPITVTVDVDVQGVIDAVNAQSTVVAAGADAVSTLVPQVQSMATLQAGQVISDTAAAAATAEYEEVTVSGMVALAVIGWGLVVAGLVMVVLCIAELVQSWVG